MVHPNKGRLWTFPSDPEQDLYALGHLKRSTGVEFVSAAVHLVVQKRQKMSLVGLFQIARDLRGTDTTELTRVLKKLRGATEESADCSVRVGWKFVSRLGQPSLPCFWKTELTPDSFISYLSIQDSEWRRKRTINNRNRPYVICGMLDSTDTR